MEISWIRENVSNVRERETERAKAHAHAAKFAHRRRMTQRQKDGLNVTEKYSPLSGCHSTAQTQVVRRRKDHPMAHPLAHKAGLDCYRSIGFELGTRTREVFEFLRSSYASSLYLTDGMTLSPWITKLVATHIFHWTMSNLKNEIARAEQELPYGLAFAKLPGTEHLRSHLWECKALVMEKARSVLELTDTQAPVDSLIAPVLQLFVAAISDSNMVEASLHGSTLQALMLRKFRLQGPSSFDTKLVLYIISHDVQFAQVTSSYTIFDPDFWISNCTTASTKPFSDHLKPFYESYTRQLNLAPRSSTLHAICLDVHKWLWLWCVEGHRELLRSMDDNAGAILYFAEEHTAFQARLNNHFIWARDGLLEMNPERPHSKASLYLRTEAVISLGILAHLATFNGNPIFNKRPIWRKVEVFLSHLQSLLRSEADNRTSHRMADDVLLYGYWVGATWEHSAEIDIQHQPKDWFSRGFIQEARRMFLPTWRSVKLVLDGICLSDFARPPGSSWVDNALCGPQEPKLNTHASSNPLTLRRAPSLLNNPTRTSQTLSAEVASIPHSTL